METKEKILLTAYRSFTEKGYHRTSMQSLVEESEFSKGAFYHYFKSKKDIYNQVVEKYFLSFYRSVDWQRYHQARLSVEEIETEICKFYTGFVSQVLSATPKGMSRYFIMYFEAFEIHPDFKEEVQAFYKNLERLLVNAVNNEKKSVELAVSIISKYEGVLFLLAVNPNENIEGLLKKINTHSHFP